MGWKDKITFLTPTYIEHTVKGQKINFYPISIKATFSLKVLGEPIAKSLSILFNKGDSLTGFKTSKTVNEKTKESHEETVTEAPTVELAVLLDSQRQEAIKALVDLLTNQDHASTIGLLLMDSLRDLFTAEERGDRTTALEFVGSLDLDDFREFIIGFIKANMKVLGPLENTVTQFLEGSLGGLLQKKDEKPAVTLTPKDQEKEKVDQAITGQT